MRVSMVVGAMAFLWGSVATPSASAQALECGCSLVMYFSVSTNTWIQNCSEVGSCSQGACRLRIVVDDVDPPGEDDDIEQWEYCACNSLPQEPACCHGQKIVREDNAGINFICVAPCPQFGDECLDDFTGSASTVIRFACKCE
jgi:hypothetical protein